MLFTTNEILAATTTTVSAALVFGQICVKAGFSRWYSLLMLVPFVNIAMILFFALAEWPIETELLQARLGAARSAQS